MLPLLISFTVLHGKDVESPKPFAIAQAFAYRRTVAPHAWFQRKAEASLWRYRLFSGSFLSCERAVKQFLYAR
jgi:hypothetical protein